MSEAWHEFPKAIVSRARTVLRKSQGQADHATHEGRWGLIWSSEDTTIGVGALRNVLGSNREVPGRVPGLWR